jgi:rRNA maturation endonuclease Nob1
MHHLSIYSIKEKRIKYKYYCTACDKVFAFSSHNNSTKHKNMAFIQSIN